MFIPMHNTLLYTPICNVYYNIYVCLCGCEYMYVTYM